MSSLFDDSFLADLQAQRGPVDEPPPPPEDDHVPEHLPDDLFGGKFDVRRTDGGPPARAKPGAGEATTATVPRAR